MDLFGRWNCGLVGPWEMFAFYDTLVDGMFAFMGRFFILFLFVVCVGLLLFFFAHV
jgi:hypothetical protein